MSLFIVTFMVHCFVLFFLWWTVPCGIEVYSWTVTLNNKGSQTQNISDSFQEAPYQTQYFYYQIPNYALWHCRTGCTYFIKDQALRPQWEFVISVLLHWVWRPFQSNREGLWSACSWSSESIDGFLRRCFLRRGFPEADWSEAMLQLGYISQQLARAFGLKWMSEDCVYCDFVILSVSWTDWFLQWNKWIIRLVYSNRKRMA